jgi:putative DNA methylase
MDQIAPGADETARFSMADLPSFIERQLPVSLLSKESYRERMAGPGQTLNALGSYWKGRKPLVLVRAVILGLLLPATSDPELDREIFLKLMLMDADGLRRRKSKPIKADRAAEILPLNVHAEAFEHNLGTLRWRRGLPRVRRDHLEHQAFDAMGTDEKLDHCTRAEEMPSSAWDSIWPDVNAYLGRFGIQADSIPSLVDQLGRMRFGHRPIVGDPFCGGGSIPFEAARIGCDVHASDLNPIACLLTWGALNVVGASDEARNRITKAQHEVARAVDSDIAALGIEHDGGETDLRLPYDAPTRWSHGWLVNRRGEVTPPQTEPYTVQCPISGWGVPMISTRQIHHASRTVLQLIPDYATKTYRLQPANAVTEDDWTEAAGGTVLYEDGNFFLRHKPGSGELKVRIANRAKAFLYCMETKCPRTGWTVSVSPRPPTRGVDFPRLFECPFRAG